MTRFDFLVDSYRTERLKILSVWSQIPDERMRFRPEPRARSPLEHMVHQCVSEEAWMRRMLGIDAGLPPLPAGKRASGSCRTTRRCPRRGSPRCGRSPTSGSSSHDVFRCRAHAGLGAAAAMTHSAHHRGQLTA